MFAKRITLLLVLIGIILTIVSVGFAVSSEQGIVGKDEIIKKDLYTSSPTVTNDGIIKGDLASVAQKLKSSGRIEGDLLCMTGDTDVSGSILGNLRSISLNTRINGDVTKNLTALSGSFYMGNDSKVYGNAMLFCDDIKIYGKIVGNTSLYAKSIVLQGEFFGDVEATLGQDKDTAEIRILPGTKIHGKLTYKGPNKAQIGSDVQIGNTQWIDTRSGEYAENYIIKHIKEFVGMIFASFIFFLLSMIFYKVFPNMFIKQGEIIRREKLKVFGIGLMTMASVLVSIFVFFIILLITLTVGVPGVAVIFGCIAFVFYLVVFFFSTMPVCVWVGEALFGKHEMSPSKSFALGLFVVSAFIFILNIFSSLPGYTGGIFSIIKLLGYMIILYSGSGTIVYLIRDMYVAIRTKA